MIIYPPMAAIDRPNIYEVLFRQAGSLVFLYGTSLITAIR